MTTDTTTPDTTAPQLITTGATRPTASGNQLVLRFSDASNLHADPARKPALGDFAVRVAGTPNAVTAVAVDGAAKTITLTLTTAVTVGQTATVAYTDSTPSDTSGIQDAIGNRLPDFAATEVNTTPDTTPPVLITVDAQAPKVNGNQLVLTYTEANTLDAAALTGNAGFTVSSTADKAITVSSAVVNGVDKTVTLTLSRAVTHRETVKLSYTKPTTGQGVQDAAGNPAADFNSQAVTNATPLPADTTPPVFSSAAVNGNQLVLTYTEASSLDAAALTGNAGFAVSGHGTDGTTPIAYGVFSAVVNATAKTVTLTLKAPVLHGQRVTVSYTKPTTGQGVQDTTGNEAANLIDQAVANNTSAEADTTPPVFRSATVNGNQLVLTYTEANNLEGAARTGSAGFAVNSAEGAAIPVTGIVVNATANTVTLTLGRAVTHTERLTVSYTKPGGNDVVQDATGNDAANLSNEAVSNDTPIPETVPPELGDVTVNGDQLELIYADENKLDAHHTAPASAFALSSSSDDVAIRVRSVAVTGKTVTLTLSRAVASDEVLTLSYTKPAGDNVIQDAASNDAPSFGKQDVENLTPEPTPALAPTPKPDPSAAKPNPVALNADSDGVSDTQERQAIGPRGSARGDGNDDGIADSAQAAVASFSAKISGSPGTSVTLVADSQGGKVTSGSHARITSLEQKTAPAETPQALETPIALTSFQATLETTGSTETFSLYVDPKIGANGYWLQDHGGTTWVNLASSPYGGKMVNEGGRLRLDFSITDGGPFDADGEANGSITASGAAAQMPLSIVGQAPNGAQDGFWF
ncbi:hypothetical protein D8B22_19675 [Verminephrobacter aporrectodeae subsp. tuberculatae]|uniref:SwmB domain-containing protein n=1 Tax=Verminephrobacter aporrectodeae TaxID=1110389 RepID=UPI002244B680|nr:SwmB domain-containing protein [Verminephrobacter aporrectodeae]MCW8167151.1 hypothetical protein [Verminephrobacter aporrectodeae subsp. tuberculatae]MCW8171265.1 hypothetical protein [Verminephrobacter aporrectodeae subsp. tuberculatae]